MRPMVVPTSKDGAKSEGNNTSTQKGDEDPINAGDGYFNESKDKASHPDLDI